jgi:hypothetical protein
VVDDVEQRVLKYVFRVVDVLAHAQPEAVNRRRDLAQHRFESGLVTCAGARHEGAQFFIFRR